LVIGLGYRREILALRWPVVIRVLVGITNLVRPPVIIPVVNQEIVLNAIKTAIFRSLSVVPTCQSLHQHLGVCFHVLTPRA